MEGTFRGHLVQPHCHGQGQLSSTRVLRATLSLNTSNDGSALLWATPSLESKWERWIQIRPWAAGGRVQTGVQHRNVTQELWPLFTCSSPRGKCLDKELGEGELLVFSMSLWSADRATATPPYVLMLMHLQRAAF